MIQSSLVINNLHGLHKVWTQTSGLISFVCHSTPLHIPYIEKAAENTSQAKECDTHSTASVTQTITIGPVGPYSL